MGHLRDRIHLHPGLVYEKACLWQGCRRDPELIVRGLPPNIGLFDPITILVEGPSVANCTEEIAHGEGTTISAMNVQNLHVIGSKMLFDSPNRAAVCAPFSRSVMIYVFSGTNSYGYRTANFTGTQNVGGQGARLDLDGEHAAGFFWASVTDAGEIEESDMRLLCWPAQPTLRDSKHQSAGDAGQQRSESHYCHVRGGCRVIPMTKPGGNVTDESGLAGRAVREQP